MTGWTFDPGYVAGSYNDDGQVWPLMFAATDNANGGSGGAVNNDRVPVVPGQSITANATFDVLSQHGNGEVFINWYNASGQMIGQSNNGPGITAGNGSGVNSVTATAPAGAAYASIAIGCSNYNEGSPGVVCSGVTWSYTPPANVTVLGTGNTGAVVSLPIGQFTDPVTNGDFEEGNVGWTLGTGFSIDQSTSAANGNWQARYTGTGLASMENTDRVPVTQGQSITASVQIALYLPSGASETSGTVAINWYDTNGNLISTTTGNTVYSDKKAAWETSTVTASAPPGAAYASLTVFANNNGVGIVGIDAARWNYQYIPQAPLGVVQDSYVYDMDGNLVSETTADGDTENWQYNPYGQVTQHTDLSGAQYSYTYDANTGAQTSESDNWSPTAQGQVAPAYVTAPITTPNSETLTYDADGQIATESFSDGSRYSYQYDANGNLIEEEDTTVDGNNNTVHTVTQTTYDSHNRISSVTETNEVTNAVMLQETFSYDAAGNRREVKASSNGSTQDAWYTYDADNRVAVTDGSLQNNQIVITDSTGSYQNAYDADGNVIKTFTRSSNGDLMAQTQRYNALNQVFETDYAVDVTQGATNNGVQQTITYDADGHALVTQNYYELGATVTVHNGNSSEPDDGDPNTSTVDVGGDLESATVNFYDVVGRMAESQTFTMPSGWDGTPSPTPSTPSPDATTYGSLTLQSDVVYQGPDGTSGYDADGDVVAYQYRDNTGRVDQYQVTYLKKDTYLQADTTGDSNVANVQPATDQSVYDTRGNQVALEQHTEDPYGTIADTVRVFAYNGNGEIIESQSGTGSSGSSIDLGSNPQAEIANYTYVNGQQLASFNNDGSQLNVLDQVTAFSSNNDSPNSYVVQSGDTLESIAQAEYGNANLWYVIAQANDLSSDTNLVLGERLQIPVVTTHSNSATTFKPYDPSGIIGSTTPNLPTIAPPPPPPGGSGGCSAAQILVLVVTIVVTVVTWGSTSELLVGELGQIAGDMAAGALAGAAGSLAGQVVGNATGIESGINWGAVGMAALGGAITGGVTGGLQEGGLGGGSAFTTGEVDAAGTPILNGLGDAVVGAASYIGNDLGAQITGQPEHFSWAGLIASTVGAGVAGEIALNLPSSGPISAGLDQATGRVVGDVVNRELSVAFGDRHVPSWAQIGEQAAGEFIADPLDSWIQAPTQDQIQARAVQNYIGQHGGNVFAAYPYQGDGAGASDSSGTVPVTPITGSNGESGFQAQDGFQTFPLQSGTSNTGANENLPGPFSKAPSYYLVQNGDSLTTILGNSNSSMVGMEARLNGMSGSTIYPGTFLALGTSADVQAGDAAVGQGTLNHDNAVIEAQRAASLAAQSTVQFADANGIDQSQGDLAVTGNAAAGNSLVVNGVDLNFKLVQNNFTLPPASITVPAPAQTSGLASLYVPPDDIAQTYSDAVNTAFNPNADGVSRALGGTVAVVSAPVAFLSGVANFIENIPYDAGVVYQDFSTAAQNAHDGDAVLYSLKGIHDTAALTFGESVN